MKSFVVSIVLFTSIAHFNLALGSDPLKHLIDKDNLRIPPHCIIEHLDTVTNEVNISVVPMIVPQPPGGRFNFDICIYNTDSLLIAGDIFVKPFEIQTYLEDYYNYGDTVSEGFPVFPDEIDAFGQDIPKIVFSIGINRVATLDQWKTLFILLDEIFELYDRKREILAQRFFETDFNVLTPEQKQIVLKHRPLDICIFFDDCIYCNLYHIDN
jgi:hypothetical protein